MIWPLPPLKNEFLALSISSNSFACGWLCASQLPNKQLHLKAYISKQIDSRITGNIINKELKCFTESYNLTHSFMSIALHSPFVHEELIRLSHASPSSNDFNSQTLKKMYWEYRYLHSLDNGQHLFYVAGIARELLFTNQLLAYTQNLNLLCITSGYMSLIAAYKALFGPSFRKSQLAIALAKSEYNIENCMHNDSLSRLLHIDPTLNLDLKKEKLSLLTMIGLYYQERDNECVL